MRIHCQGTTCMIRPSLSVKGKPCMRFLRHFIFTFRAALTIRHNYTLCDEAYVYCKLLYIIKYACIEYSVCEVSIAQRGLEHPHPNTFVPVRRQILSWYHVFQSSRHCLPAIMILSFPLNHNGGKFVHSMSEHVGSYFYICADLWIKYNKLTTLRYFVVLFEWNGTKLHMCTSRELWP